MSMISIIGSCKNEENNIDELYSQIKLLFENKLKDHELELILIDNASTDLTVEKIKKLCLNDSRVKLIENIKDYGQDKSPYYAFIQSSGDYIVPIVTDLQDPIAGKSSSNDQDFLKQTWFWQYQLLKRKVLIF